MSSDDRVTPDERAVLGVLVRQREAWSRTPPTERLRLLEQVRGRALGVCGHWGRAVAALQGVAADERVVGQELGDFVVGTALTLDAAAKALRPLAASPEAVEAPLPPVEPGWEGRRRFRLFPETRREAWSSVGWLGLHAEAVTLPFADASTRPGGALGLGSSSAPPLATVVADLSGGAPLAALLAALRSLFVEMSTVALVLPPAQVALQPIIEYFLEPVAEAGSFAALVPGRDETSGVAALVPGRDGAGGVAAARSRPSLLRSVADLQRGLRVDRVVLVNSTAEERDELASLAGGVASAFGRSSERALAGTAASSGVFGPRVFADGAKSSALVVLSEDLDAEDAAAARLGSSGSRGAPLAGKRKRSPARAWSDIKVDHVARETVEALASGSGAGLGAPRLVLIDDQWKYADAFIARVRTEIALYGARAAPAPGAAERVDEARRRAPLLRDGDALAQAYLAAKRARKFRREHGEAVRIASPGTDDDSSLLVTAGEETAVAEGTSSEGAAIASPAPFEASLSAFGFVASPGSVPEPASEELPIVPSLAVLSAAQTAALFEASERLGSGSDPVLGSSSDPGSDALLSTLSLLSSPSFARTPALVVARVRVPGSAPRPEAVLAAAAPLLRGLLGARLAAAWVSAPDGLLKGREEALHRFAEATGARAVGVNASPRFLTLSGLVPWTATEDGTIQAEGAAAADADAAAAAAPCTPLPLLGETRMLRRNVSHAFVRLPFESSLTRLVPRHTFGTLATAKSSAVLVHSGFLTAIKVMTDKTI